MTIPDQAAQHVSLSADAPQQRVRLSGRGDVTVLLETGLGVESTGWQGVEAALSEDARLISYDRPGRGGSERPKRARSLGDVIVDIDALLDHLGIRGPIIAVGHSFGGFIARQLAAQRPQVVGLVLVDSMHRDQFRALGPLFPDPQPGEAGVIAAMRTFWRTAWRDPEANPERIAFETVFEEDARVRDLGGLPVRMMTAGSFLRPPLGSSGAGPRLQAEWNRLQDDLGKLSTDVRRSYVEDSGHFIQVDKPDLVATEIRGLLADL